MRIYRSIILGIDPGSRVTVMVIRQNGRHLEYLGSGAIHAGRGFTYTLKTIYAGVTEIIHNFRPICFAIEQVFMAKMRIQL